MESSASNEPSMDRATKERHRKKLVAKKRRDNNTNNCNGRGVAARKKRRRFLSEKKKLEAEILKKIEALPTSENETDDEKQLKFLNAVIEEATKKRKIVMANINKSKKRKQNQKDNKNQKAAVEKGASGNENETVNHIKKAKTTEEPSEEEAFMARFGDIIDKNPPSNKNELVGRFILRNFSRRQNAVNIYIGCVRSIEDGESAYPCLVQYRDKEWQMISMHLVRKLLMTKSAAETIREYANEINKLRELASLPLPNGPTLPNLDGWR